MLKILYSTDSSSASAPLNKFNIAKSFPVEKEASFEEITNATDLEVSFVYRLLRHGITINCLFLETK